jgi:hypothetical protein
VRAVAQKIAQHSVKLLLMQDEQMIKALAPHTAQKAFTDGIRSRGVRRCVENLDATHMCNPCEAHPKLAIVIPKKVFRSLPIGSGFSQLLRYPGIARRSWRCVDTDMDHFARV